MRIEVIEHDGVDPDISYLIRTAGEPWQFHDSPEKAIFRACEAYIDRFIDYRTERGHQSVVLDLVRAVDREARVPIMGTPPEAWAKFFEHLKVSPPLAMAVVATYPDPRLPELLVYYATSLVALSFISPGAQLLSEAMQVRLRRRLDLPEPKNQE